MAWQMQQMQGLQWAIGGLMAMLGFAFANRAKLRRWWRRRAAKRRPGQTPGAPTEP